MADTEMEKRLTALRAASTYLFKEGNQNRDKDKIAWSMALDHIADFITERLTPSAEARREVARHLRELAQDDEDNMRFEQPNRRAEIALMRLAAAMLEE